MKPEKPSKIHIKDDIPIDQEEIVMYRIFQVIQCARSSKRFLFLYVRDLHIKSAPIPKVFLDAASQMPDHQCDLCDILFLQALDLILQHRFSTDPYHRFCISFAMLAILVPFPPAIITACMGSSSTL